MNKRSFCSCVSLFITSFIYCQKINVHGFVVNITGSPVSFATIKNVSAKQELQADSAGYFSFESEINSKLLISSIGYNDTTLTVTSQDAIGLVIKLSTSLNKLNSVSVETKQRAAQFNQTLARAVAEGNLYFTQENGGVLGNRNEFSSIVIDPIKNRPVLLHIITDNTKGRFASNATITEIHHKEDTHGSTFFFNSWAKGIVVDTAYNVIDDNSCYYNYNKILGSLIMTKDFINGLAVDPQSIQFFILADSLKQTYTFIKVPAISSNLFCILVAMSDNYDIFRLTTTKFVKSNYSTDGMVSSGNAYDEYVDKNVYYLLDVSNNISTAFSLKKKSILSAFRNNDKVGAYLESNKNEIDDEYLKNLIKTLKED